VPFVPASVRKPGKVIALLLIQVTKVSHALPDRISIGPDKGDAKQQFDQMIVEFNKVTDPKLSYSNELLTALSNLEKSLLMARVTPQ
jgi:hypothetical protein